MEFNKTIQNRKTIREFCDKAIPSKIFEEVIRTGLMAPSHDHKRAWHFIRISDLEMRFKIVEDIERLKSYPIKSLPEGYSLAQKMYFEAMPYQKSMLIKAPELLAVCFEMQRDVVNCNNLYQLNALASVWCCIENMLLTMAANDLMGVTYIPKNQEGLKQALKLPDQYYVSALLAMGYPSTKAERCEQEVIKVKNRIHDNTFHMDKLQKVK